MSIQDSATQQEPFKSKPEANPEKYELSSNDLSLVSKKNQRQEEESDSEIEIETQEESNGAKTEADQYTQGGTTSIETGRQLQEKSEYFSRDQGKMFIGGLNWDTSEQRLREYFSQYGEIIDLTIMRDGNTGRSRGFGFLTFLDPRSVDEALQSQHVLDGKVIDPKRAIPKEEQDKTGKIFVGGIAPEVTEKDFDEFFSQFGNVIDAQLMIDKDTRRSRGFGFVTYDSPQAVNNVTQSHYLELKGKRMEIKKAEPRGQQQQMTGGMRGYNSNTALQLHKSRHHQQQQQQFIPRNLNLTSPHTAPPAAMSLGHRPRQLQPPMGYNQYTPYQPIPQAPMGGFSPQMLQQQYWQQYWLQMNSNLQQYPQTQGPPPPNQAQAQMMGFMPQMPHHAMPRNPFSFTPGDSQVEPDDESNALFDNSDYYKHGDLGMYNGSVNNVSRGGRKNGAFQSFTR